jgi:hypothetical protein
MERLCATLETCIGALLFLWSPVVTIYAAYLLLLDISEPTAASTETRIISTLILIRPILMNFQDILSERHAPFEHGSAARRIFDIVKETRRRIAEVDKEWTIGRNDRPQLQFSPAPPMADAPLLASMKQELEEATHELAKVDRETNAEVDALRAKWVDAERARNKALKRLQERRAELAITVRYVSHFTEWREQVQKLYEANAFEELPGSGIRTKLELVFWGWDYNRFWRDPATNYVTNLNCACPPRNAEKCLVFNPKIALEIARDANLSAEEKYTKLMEMFDAFLGE